jgi:hypothetical protein
VSAVRHPSTGGAVAVWGVDGGGAAYPPFGATIRASAFIGCALTLKTASSTPRLGGGALLAVGPVNLDIAGGCLFQKNTAEASGGAVAIRVHPTLGYPAGHHGAAISDATFKLNHAPGGGAGVCMLNMPQNHRADRVLLKARATRGRLQGRSRPGGSGQQQAAAGSGRLAGAPAPRGAAMVSRPRPGNFGRPAAGRFGQSAAGQKPPRR